MISVLPVARLLAVPFTVVASPQDSAIAFINVSVIPMDRERILTDQTVLVHGDRITAIGPSGAVAIPTHTRRIDGQEKFLIPGLADMHTHIVRAPRHRLQGKEQTVEQMLTAYIANGVTTVRIMSGGPDHVALREQVRTGEQLGPTIYTAGPPVLSLPSPEVAMQLVADHKAAGYDLIKLGSARLTRVALDSLAVATRRAQLPFGGHIPGGDMRAFLEARPKSIEHLDGYWGTWEQPYRPGRSFKAKLAMIEAGDVRLDDSSLAAAAAATQRAGIWNVPTKVVFHTLSSQSNMQAWQMSEAQHQRYMALFDRIVRALRDAGAGLLVGTDANSLQGVWSGSSVHTELQLLVAAGLTPYQAIEAGTRNVAVFWGTLDRTGTVEVGKRADLVLLTGNPLEDIRNTVRPAGVMLGGRWLARTTLDARLTELGVPKEWW